MDSAAFTEALTALAVRSKAGPISSLTELAAVRPLRPPPFIDPSDLPPPFGGPGGPVNDENFLEWMQRTSNIVDSTKQELANIKDQTAQQVRVAQQIYNADQNLADFVNRMNAARAQAKTLSDAAIDSAFNKFQQMGESCQAAREDLVTYFGKTTEVIAGLTACIDNALASAVDKVLPGLGGIVAMSLGFVEGIVTGALSAIEDGISSAWDAITSIF